MNKIRVNSYIPVTKVEGPETRFCLWLQGCSIQCKGCANKTMWDKNGGTLYEVQEIINLIKSYSSKIQGITFLGGEPLEQIEAVIAISKAVQKIGLSVLVFTGYTYNEAMNIKSFKELIKYVDILIDGRYEEDKQDFSRAWVGSSNQNYHFLSNKYNENILQKYKNQIEIRVKENNVTITGMGDFSLLANTI